MQTQHSGSALLTADGVVLQSGKPTRLFAIHIISGAGGGGVIDLYNGTASTDTLYIKEQGTANGGKNILYGDQGFFFPAGLYCDLDANTTSVLFEISQ